MSTNDSPADIYIETERTNQESAHERILTPLSNGCGRYRVLGSAYNQHIIEGAQILIPYFEVVVIRLSWTFSLAQIFAVGGEKFTHKMPKRKVSVVCTIKLTSW